MADSAEAKRKPSPLEILQEAQSDPQVARLYANGFAVGMTNADIAIVLHLDAKPTAVLHVSFTLAKTLAQRLGRVVSEFESNVGTELVTTDKIDAVFTEKKVT